MGLGWTLTAEGQYRVPWSVDLSERQQGLLDQVLASYAGPAPGQSVLEYVRQLLTRLCRFERVRYDKAWAEPLCALAMANLDGYGVLSYLLQVDQLEEIAVVGLNVPIYVYDRKSGWQTTNAVLTDLDFAIQCVNRMAQPLGRRLTSRQPRLSAVLPDGSRLHACMAPVALSGIQISLRKFRKEPFSMRELVQSGFLSAPVAAFLQLALPSDCSLLVAGNTGSGKTTLLNALSEFVPLHERVVVLEDAPELRWPHCHQARLLSGGTPLSSLLADTLRMRPGRIIVGEVRTATEASALFDVLLSGQAKGAFATFHAESAADALSRLQSMGVRTLDLDALQLVCVLQRYTSVRDGCEKRALVELSAVHQGLAVPVLDGRGKVHPDFFQTRAASRMQRGHSMDALGLSRRVSVLTEDWR